MLCLRSETNQKYPLPLLSLRFQAVWKGQKKNANASTLERKQQKIVFIKQMA